ncbi:hypothetical protein QRN89_33800 [Streptomyces chengbuensis]|uniref:hypothetical protein n=1 Tax=Streptomyces TaxID=1883 RepID=UPI0025B5D453|nr:hypothetical protein [Streptomyces sp. HUAS CB01]WJY54342.1 hypothetical protein QRN89_33800 [Streptomyces sp. HUAS CB01]
MGTYLVSVGARAWFARGEEDDDEAEGPGPLAAALNEELVRRGLPPYTSVPGEPGGRGPGFEEKFVASMDGYTALCRSLLSPEEEETVCGWTVLVPFSLDEPVRLPMETSFADETVVAGAPQVLAALERLEAAVGLPDGMPSAGRNLELTAWYLDAGARAAAAARPGSWGADPDTVFHVALYLRAARYSLRHGCPLVHT